MKNIFSRNNGKSTKDGLRSLHHFIDETATVKIEPLAKLEPTPEPKEESKDEWIWVEGYKGTNKDMKCRDYQYELGGAYHIDSEVKDCENGFHLCLKLEDVFGYYEPGNGNRYFKVKALVRKSDYDEYGLISNATIMIGGCPMPNPWKDIRDKLAAKEIIFMDEVEQHELYANIRVAYSDLKYAPDKIIEKAIKDSLGEARHPYRVSILIEDGYSEAFANYICESDEDSVFEKAHMLASQKDLSMDVRVLAILKMRN